MKAVVDPDVGPVIVLLHLVSHPVGLTLEKNYPKRVRSQNFWESNNR